MIIELKSHKEKISNLRFTHMSVLYGHKGQEKWRVILLLENKMTGVKVPHPLTEFFSDFNNLRHSSVVQKVYYIVPFLNYTFFDNASVFKLRSLSELSVEHGIDFLNDFGGGLLGKKTPCKDTVIAAERVLIQFYSFLLEKDILNESINIKMTTAEYSLEGTKGIKYIKSPFKGVKYPRNKHTNRLKSIPYELILTFIDVAILETPDIALGIYLQIFGGLRISEIINIGKNSIELIGYNGELGMNIDLKRRFFDKQLLNNNGKGGVKKPRIQYILPILDLLPRLFKKHIETYHKNYEFEPLFLDSNNNAMSEKNYRDRFNRLKENFIKCLEFNKDPYLKTYAIALRSKKWNSHICRGTFSKLIADYTNNPTELAVLRGDSTYESALPYIQGSFGVQDSINKVMSKFYNDLLY